MDVNQKLTTAWDLPEGASGAILGVCENIEVCLSERITDMGFCKGAFITCIKTPPFKSPHLFRIQNTVYALDKDTAQSIKVNITGI